MYNALFSDKTRDDLKEMKREIRTISEKLKSQMTLGEQGVDLIYLPKCNKVIMYKTAWSYFVGRKAK